MPKTGRVPGAARIRLSTPLTPKWQERMEYVQKLLATSMPHEMIRRQIITQYHVGYHTAEDWIRKARELWAAEPVPEDFDLRKQYVKTLQVMANRAMADKAFQAAFRAHREAAIVQGLYPAGTLPGGRAADDAMDGEESIAVQDPDRVRERMAELAAKHLAKVQAASTHAEAPAGPANALDGQGGTQGPDPGKDAP